MQDPLIARVKAELSKIRYADQGQDPLLTASEELESLKTATATATDEILGIAEAVLSDVEKLRAMVPSGPGESLLDGIERQLGRLFEACGFQDLTGQRSTKVARLLERLDARVGNALDLMDHIEVPDDIALQMKDAHAVGEAALLNGPQLTGEGLRQDDIDSLFN